MANIISTNACLLAQSFLVLFSTNSAHFYILVSYSKKSNNQNIIHYLDDFLLAGKAHDPCCRHTLDTFHQICAQLGVPIAKDKTVEHTTRLTFLGIEFDTVGMTMRLPQNKLTELQRRIQETLHTSKTTLRDLQSIIGLLNFASQGGIR